MSNKRVNYCYNFRFGVICAFATNEVLEEGVTNLPKNVRTSLTDTELYINNTKKVSCIFCRRR